MIPKIPADPVARAERKANLLLASEVLRGQAALAVDDLGGRADRWAVRINAWRNLLSNPLVLATAGGGAAFFAASGPQHGTSCRAAPAVRVLPPRQRERWMPARAC